MTLFRAIVRNVGRRPALVANLGSTFSKVSLEKRVGLVHATGLGDVWTRASPNLILGPMFMLSHHTHSSAGGRYLEDVKNTATFEMKKFYLRDVMDMIIWRIENGIEGGTMDPKKMPVIDNKAHLPDEPYVIDKYPKYLDSIKSFIIDFHQADIERMTPYQLHLFQDFTGYLQKTTQVRHLVLLRRHPHLHTPEEELAFIPAAYDRFHAIPDTPSIKHFPAICEDHHNSPVDPPSDDDPNRMRCEKAYKMMVKRNNRKVDIKNSIAHLPVEFEDQRAPIDEKRKKRKNEYLNTNPMEEIRYHRNTLKHIHEKFTEGTVVEHMELLKMLRTANSVIPMELFQFYWCYDGHAGGAIDLTLIYDTRWIYKREDL